MSLQERLQHGVLLLAFVLLAITGFALKYPESGWVRLLGLSEELRHRIHLSAALVFVALAFYHLGYLTLSRRGRDTLRELLPARRDVRSVFHFFASRLGLRPPWSSPGRFSYVAKVEYWALVWGSVIMGVTGLALAFPWGFMRHFPGWGLDVAETIHFYEAILATLAVAIWHMYTVMFDPSVYPMNWSWLVGQTKPADAASGAPPAAPPPGATPPKAEDGARPDEKA